MVVASTMILPIFYLFFSTFLLTALSQTPEFIKPCRKSDPEINTCAANSIDHLRKYILSGIPDLDLPPLDPLRIPKLQLENGSGRIRVKAVLSDLIIYGAANHTITNIRADAKAYTLQIAAKAPRLAVTGKYEVIGNVLVLNIRSKGDFQAVFEDGAGLVKLQGQEKIINGVKYMQVEKIGIDFKLGRARFRIRDRSSNNKVLSEAINNFLNQNWREVIDEMKYTASTTIGMYIKKIINAALLKIPMNLWLIED